MAINQLPLEVLQEVMSYLSYDELKIVSLVCHRWNQASGTFITRNGQLRIHEQVVKNLKVIRRSIRDYQSVAIGRIVKWEQLRTAISECMERFPNARKLYLTDVLQGCLDRIYQAYRSWMERLESLNVSLNDRLQDLSAHQRSDKTRPGSADYVLTLPNLRQLYWTECLHGHRQKTVTIDAPGLEYVNIKDGCIASSAVLRIHRCERIKHIRCVFFRTQFKDVFFGDLSSVETLILEIKHDKCDVSCLSKMPKLRYLSLSFGNAINYLEQVEAMPSSQLLKSLSIGTDGRNAEKGTLNLKKVLSNFRNLETLDLSLINIKTNDDIQANQLVCLELREVACSSSTFSLTAPKLQTLSLEVDMLDNLQLSKSKRLSELYVDLGVSALKDSFEQIIYPFLQEHTDIKVLTLIRGILFHLVQDDVIHDCIVDSVEHLELQQFDITINFFPLLARWKSLKSLKLVACTVNCSEMRNDVLLLPELERMSIERVHLRGTSRNDFPILLVNGANQEVVLNDDTRLFSTNT